MVENDQLGIRSNKGFYNYDDNGEKAIHTRDDNFLDLLKLQNSKEKKVENCFIFKMISVTIDFGLDLAPFHFKYSSFTTVCSSFFSQ